MGGLYFWLGASAEEADRAGGLRPEPVAQSQPKALIPCATCDGTGKTNRYCDGWNVWKDRCPICDGRGSYTMGQLFGDEQ